ncbi:MAG: DUF5686 and carboxypeptidase regulatory-like domain-containing protein [Candidatus Cyclobacteriaceae bacterium M2_1C_046]
MRYLFLIILAPFLSFVTYAGTVKGYVYDEEGNPLPYTTIYVEETGNGTVANEEAYFELKLDAGTYHLVFQYIGYQSITKEITVADDVVAFNVTLNPTAMVLREIEVKAGKEDPAYAIMRRAIAKAGYHLNQLDSFSAKVYIKGTGQVNDIPFLFRKTLEKEGLDTSRIFITESLNEISFKRPNTFSERVISIRSSGDDNNTNPNNYVFTSFYQPEIAKSISPLSPKAFAYYKFSYEGTFEDRGYEVSKIKVTPRSRGDNVFEGYLQIVEGLWSIHSFNLKGTKLGFTFKINQNYAPIQERIWMPTTAKVDFEGSVLGFDFEYKYLASISDYNLFVNPDLDYEFTVVDEKSEPEKAEEVIEITKSEEVQKLEEIVATKEVTRKQLKKLVKEYEKIERELQEDPDVISRSYFKVDSNAYTMDSAYWAKIRPIPLTERENVGYQQVDSIASVEKAKSEGDTLKVSKKKKGFQPQDLLFGDRYKIGDKAYLTIHNLITNSEFNTVEGLALDYSISFSKTFKELKYLKITPTARYGFSREEFNGKVDLHYGFGPREHRNDLFISGGRYIEQFNPSDPIHPLVNTAMTLFLERNYMKIYEQDYLSASYSKKLSDKADVQVSSIWSERHQLFNNSDYRLINRDAVTNYLPNAPHNLELEDTGFPVHEALTFEFKGKYQPWLKYKIRNNKKFKVDNSSPTFELIYRTAKPFGFAEVDYDLLELGVRHSFYWGVRGKIDLKLSAGKFLRKENMYFMDYKHFEGNQIPIVTADPVGSFRLMDYYSFSTNDEYFTAHGHYQFRKFLLTQILEFRMMGIRENFLVNYLATPTAENYVEVGYSIDYILRIFRLEAVTSFRDGRYQDFGVRLGIATNLDELF